jgi:hypothetical protein
MARGTLPNDTTVKRNWHGPAYLKVRSGFLEILCRVDLLVIPELVCLEFLLEIEVYATKS